MGAIYVLSLTPYAGKTTILLGLGEYLRRKGRSFTYRRPLGGRPVESQGEIVDGDALFVSQALGLKLPPGSLSAVLLTQEFLIGALRGKEGDLRKKILAFLQAAVSEKEDLLIHGYGGLYAGYFLGIEAPRILKEFPAKVLLVVRYQGLETLDFLLRSLEDLKGAPVGLIFNALSSGMKEEFGDFVKPFLEDRGIQILGELPWDTVLAGISVKELQEALQARSLFPFEGDPLVEHFLIGGMQVDQAIQYFRRTRHFGVIVVGDRSDIQLAALETGARCLLLTGGLYPNEIILSRAEEAGVPVLVVSGDTYSVARQVERLSREAPLRHPLKVARARELFAQYVSSDRLEEFL